MSEILLLALQHGTPYGIIGQKVFTAASTEMNVPEGVTEIHAVCVGGGSGNYVNARGGAGGDLRWRNHIPVTPGEILVVSVGAAVSAARGLSTKITRKATGEVLLIAKGGAHLTDVSTAIALPDIGGGDGGVSTGYHGGAPGGYSGDGPAGVTSAPPVGSGAPSTGGAYVFNSRTFGCGSGGVGLNGRGADGARPTTSTASGYGGSGGSNGSSTTGGNYGGSGGGSPNLTFAIAGTQGGARIIWGSNRAYPDTNTKDL